MLLVEGAGVTTFQTDYQLATGDSNLQAQVRAAIYAYAQQTYGEQPSTTIASGSNAAALPQTTINVASTTNFPSSGTVTVYLSSATTTVVSYTGVTATTLTGCTGGSGTLQTSQGVVANTVYNHAARAYFASQVVNGRVSIPDLILSAVSFATLNDSSADATVSNAIATLWNLWAGA